MRGVRRHYDTTAAELAVTGLHGEMSPPSRVLAIVLVLAMGTGDGPSLEESLGDLRLLGLEAMIDPPRDGALGAVTASREAGVRVMMITGDHPRTALAVGRTLGLSGRRAVTGAELEAADDDTLRDRVRDADVYARLIRDLKRQGVITIVDTDGDPLRRSVRAEPDVISPNELEAEELVGHEFNDDEDRLLAVTEMCQLGAREAIMTMPDGVFARTGPQDAGGDPCLYRVRMGEGTIEPRATVGSGDAFLAGFVAARYNGLGTEECLVHGVACGAQSTQHLGAGLIDRNQVERLVSEIEVERPAISAEVT